MFAFPFDADLLSHCALLVAPPPDQAATARLLDACAARDPQRLRVTVLCTAPWPAGRALLKPFGVEYLELGNVYGRKGLWGRSRLLLAKLREIGATEARWFQHASADWRLAARFASWSAGRPPTAERATPGTALDPIRIAILLKSDLAEPAAHVTQVIQTAVSLVGLGAAVSLVAPLSHGTLAELLERVGAAGLPPERLLHRPLRPSRRSVSYARHLDATLDELAATGHGTLYFRQPRIASMILPRARELGMRVFMEAHHSYVTWALYQRRELWRGTSLDGASLRYHRLLSRADRDHERRVYDELDGVLCTTDALVRHVRRLVGDADKVCLLRNGAPETDPAQATAAADVRDVDVIYTGRTDASKGTDVLIEAMTHLPDVRLDIIGGPTDADLAPYRRLAAETGVVDRVGFATWESQPRLFERIRRARVAVHPITGRGSREWRIFTCPLKVMEYMALGTPVVTTDLPAIRELIAHGESGLLVAPGDARALAAGIGALLNDQALATRLAAAARETVRPWQSAARAQRLFDFICPARVQARAPRPPVTAG